MKWHGVTYNVSNNRTISGDPMYVEEQQPVKAHRLILQNRASLQVTGVIDVISYDPGEIILETSAGLLLIKGSELHMNHLSLEKGETGVDGTVDSLTYSEANRGAKQAERFLGRLFR